MLFTKDMPVTKDMPGTVAFYRDAPGLRLAGAGLVCCEGKDPDGNPFSISDRR